MEQLSQKSVMPEFRSEVKQFCDSQGKNNIDLAWLSELIVTARENIFDYFNDEESQVIRDLGMNLSPDMVPGHLLSIYSSDPCISRPEIDQTAFVFGLFATTLLRLAETSSFGFDTNFEFFRSYANYLAKILDGNAFIHP